MGALFRFAGVRCEASEQAHTFTLHAGDARLLQLSSAEEKNALIDFALGETVCSAGTIEIAQGDRRRKKIAANPERRHSSEPVPLIWQPLGESRLGAVAWVAPNGALISNLRIWENVTLPLWFHERRDAADTEQSVMYWLGMLGMDQDRFEKFMAAQPYSIETWQCKLAGLLRALLQTSPVLVVDAALFADVRTSLVRCWVTALETYAAAGRAVLVVADRETPLSWEMI